MNREELIDELLAGRLDRQAFTRALDAAAVAELGHARLDLERAARTGEAEVVFCQGKTPQQVADIFTALARRNGRALGTRADAAQRDAVSERLDVHWDPVSRLLIHDPGRSAGAPGREQPGQGKVLVVSAGTADHPVAEEAAATCEFLGSRVVRVFDCGVAGLHRVAGVVREAEDARAVVVAAGMDGALPSVVAGLVAAPVVALPTGVGYGASFGGLAALLTMLNACAPGVTVVNIDNGFGAGYAAHRINMQASR